MNTDYYKTLEIKRDATPADIKRAYRKLSLKYHPDLNGGKEFYVAKFQSIVEADEVLKDPMTRLAYGQNSSNFSHNRSSSQSGNRTYANSNGESYRYQTY